jgi:transposase
MGSGGGGCTHMIPIPQRILLATTPVSFRNSIDGLAAIVETQLKEQALSGTLFVFRNRMGNALKLLYWSHGGFLLIYKKLERGCFHLPTTETDRKTLTHAEILAILEGIDLQHAHRLKRWNPEK